MIPIPIVSALMAMLPEGLGVYIPLAHLIVAWVVGLSFIFPAIAVLNEDTKELKCTKDPTDHHNRLLKSIKTASGVCGLGILFILLGLYLVVPIMIAFCCYGVYIFCLGVWITFVEFLSSTNKK